MGTDVDIFIIQQTDSCTDKVERGERDTRPLVDVKRLAAETSWREVVSSAVRLAYTSGESIHKGRPW